MNSIKDGLEKVLNDLEFIHADLRDVACESTPVENMVVTRFLKQVAELHREMEEFQEARRAAAREDGENTDEGIDVNVTWSVH